MTKKKIYDILSELDDAINLDGSEWGETMALQVQLYQSSLISEKLAAALEKEIRSQYKAFKEYAIIVEEIETRTTTVRRLEWT